MHFIPYRHVVCRKINFKRGRCPGDFYTIDRKERNEKKRKERGGIVLHFGNAFVVKLLLNF